MPRDVEVPSNNDRIWLVAQMTASKFLQQLQVGFSQNVPRMTIQRNAINDSLLKPHNQRNSSAMDDTYRIANNRNVWFPDNANSSRNASFLGDSSCCPKRAPTFPPQLLPQPRNTIFSYTNFLHKNNLEGRVEHFPQASNTRDVHRCNTHLLRVFHIVILW